MSKSRPTPLLLPAVGLILILLALYFLTHRDAKIPTAFLSADNQTPAASTPDLHANDDAAPELPVASEDELARTATTAALAEKLTQRLNSRATRPHEAVLIFKDVDGYRRFLARAAQAGVVVAGQIDELNIVRVRVRAYDTFAAELVARAADYGGISANTFVQIPPKPEERLTGPQAAVNNTLLATLGVAAGTDTSTWGRGVTIAVLDGGASSDPTLGARLKYQDIGYGFTGNDSSGLHGTAVASIAAGSAPDAPGVAPAAYVLSIRVIATDGKSDIFTVTQAIVAAVEGGAQIINLSLGGYSTSEALTRAITYANGKGVVIVAAAGNDGASRLTWPAADPRVVSVGATDANGLQTSFSNSGAQLRLTAPGYGIQTAALAGERALFSGTSASAPVVSGAIAVIMSQTPGLTAAQAVEILQTHADDNGAAGLDPDYGSGIVDLGWALNRANPTRVDTAVASHYFNRDTGSVEIVVQNRGAQNATNLTLGVTVNGKPTTYTISALAASQSLPISIHVTEAETAAPITIRSALANPEGVIDAVPSNNMRATQIDLSK